MQPTTILFAPWVDAALGEIIDHVDVDSIPTVLERIQSRLVQTITSFPEAGLIFWRGLYFSTKAIRPRVRSTSSILIAPSRNWRFH